MHGEEEARERRVAGLLGIRHVDRWLWALRHVQEVEDKRVAERARVRALLGSEDPTVAVLLQQLAALKPPFDACDGAARWLAEQANEHGTFCGRCGADFTAGDAIYRQAVDLSTETSSGKVRRRWMVTSVCGLCAQRDRDWWRGRCAVCDRTVYGYTGRAWVVACCARHARRAVADQQRDLRGPRTHPADVMTAEPFSMIVAGA